FAYDHARTEASRLLIRRRGAAAEEVTEELRPRARPTDDGGRVDVDDARDGLRRNVGEGSRALFGREFRLRERLFWGLLFDALLGRVSHLAALTARDAPPNAEDRQASKVERKRSVHMHLQIRTRERSKRPLQAFVGGALPAWD